MDSALYANYLNILKQELVPALGCTEPIAIAYAAAKARQILGEVVPDTVEMLLTETSLRMLKVLLFRIPADLKELTLQLFSALSEEMLTKLWKY